jgi:hypothetical protein
MNDHPNKHARQIRRVVDQGNEKGTSLIRGCLACQNQ